MNKVLIFMRKGELASFCSELFQEKQIEYHITDNFYTKKKAEYIIADGKIGGAGLIHEYTSKFKNIKSLILIERRDDIWIAKWSKATLALLYPINLFDFEKAIKQLINFKDI